MMVAQCGPDRVEASRVLERRSGYRCPACGSAVVLHARVDGWVVPHFKHKAPSGCLNGNGESPAHRATKTLLSDHYRSKGHPVELEFSVGARRADVFIADLKVVFEVEFSAKEVPEFLAKCRDYIQVGLRSVWVFRQKNINMVDVAIGNSLIVEVSRVLDLFRSGQRPRGTKPAFFIYDGKQVIVFRGKLSPLMLYKEYDEYSGGGGYQYPSRRRMWLSVKDVICMGPPSPKHPNTRSNHCAEGETCAVKIDQVAA